MNIEGKPDCQDYDERLKIESPRLKFSEKRLVGLVLI